MTGTTSHEHILVINANNEKTDQQKIKVSNKLKMAEFYIIYIKHIIANVKHVSFFDGQLLSNCCMCFSCIKLNIASLLK